MLAVARTTDPGATIEWHEATAETLPLADERFDVVLCQLGLQFISDKQMALREMWRVLVSCGRVLINVCGPTPPLFTVLEEALDRHLGPAAAEFVRTVFSLDDADELRDLVSDVGFKAASTSSALRTLRACRRRGSSCGSTSTVRPWQRQRLGSMSRGAGFSSATSYGLAALRRKRRGRSGGRITVATAQK
jgi:SAM-dependent methyltransferase